MTDQDICFSSVAELTFAFAKGQLTAKQIVCAFIDRAIQHAALNSYLTLDRQGALAAAARLDRAHCAQEPIGPLAGVVIGLKDSLCTQGVATTAGSKILDGWIPPYDATVVTRLRAAGAIILGKLNMDEFAMGSSTETSAYGVCRNPWDLDRVPGGSSGGSAAAVAAGLCTVALGSDTGGSIRQPAGFCGVVGVKPTYGRVSRYGLIAFASSLDCVGPLARRVDDAARVLEVISGHDRRDATSMVEPSLSLTDTHLNHGVAGLTIGVPREFFPDDLDREVAASIRAAIAKLESAGATIREISLPHSRYALACYYLVATAEASSNLARYDGVRYGQRVDASSLEDMYGATRSRFFGTEVKRRILLGTFALRAGYVDAYYAKAQKVRRLVKSDFDNTWASGVDVIATPTSPTPAFAIGAKSTPLDMYLADLFTLSCNLAGLPAATVPADSVRGLPVGLQLITPAKGESILFQVARCYEQIARWDHRQPPELS